MGSRFRLIIAGECFKPFHGIGWSLKYNQPIFGIFKYTLRSTFQIIDIFRTTEEGPVAI